jgi:hypothetical protein
MVAAAVRREEFRAASQAPAPSRDAVLARYRALRRISKQHQTKALALVSTDAMLQQARRLGLAQGKTLILDSIDEMTLIYDLAVHTAPPGRTRALDRYVRSARVAPGSDEARVLEAMRQARFAIGVVLRRHEAAGLIMFDIFRETEFWLVDEGFEISLAEGATVATRYYTPDSFAMTAGFGVPIDRDMLERALDAAPQLLRKSHTEALDDRHFAEAIFRQAVLNGITANMKYQDPPGTGPSD